MDNIFVERLWRSLKYEEVYLKAYETAAEAKAGIGDWFTFYNEERPHQALGYRTPVAVYSGCSWKPSDRAVDMMDIADAMPTSPQPTTAAGFQLI
jgi:putative transposase